MLSRALIKTAATHIALLSLLAFSAGCPQDNTKTGPAKVTLPPVDSALVGEIPMQQIEEWKTAAVLNDDEGAAFSLGVSYLLGESVEKNEAEAKKLLDKLKDAKSPGIRMFVKRLETKADEAMVKKWMDEGKAGDVNAMLNVGVSYFLGEGIGEDRIQALKWITGAASRHEMESAFDLVLGRVGERLTFQQQGFARRKAREEGLETERVPTKSK